jgi:hypothetical protein
VAQLDMKDLARIGAQARLRELELEIESIVSMFPELRAGLAGSGKRRGRPARKSADAGAPQAAAAVSDGGASGARKRRIRRPKMSAANRKAQSLRMKKYWAARRKAEGKAA